MPPVPTRTPPPVPVQEDERARLGEFTLFPTEDPFAPTFPEQAHSPISQLSAPPFLDPTRPAPRPQNTYFQPGTTYYEHDADPDPEPDAVAPLTASPPQSTFKKQRIGPEVSPSRPMTTTTSPVAPPLPRHGSARSVASTFSTPGRDEMERKRGIADEGPFKGAMGLKELEETRRMVSGGGRGEGDVNREKEKEDGLCRCVVM